MTKEEILKDMIAKCDAYVADWHNVAKWEAYVEAWKSWKHVRGGE